MVKMTSLQLPDTLLTDFDGNPDRFIREMRIAAAVRWYEMGLFPRKKPQKLLISRARSLLNLYLAISVDFIQYTPEELAEEMFSVD